MTKVEGSRKRSADKDFTQGPLFLPILLFALPVLATGVLQFLYNAADVFIVSRFAADGNTALSAVSSTGSLSNLITGLFIGLSVGASVTISHAIGAGRPDEANKIVHTAITMSLVLGSLVAVFGFLAAKPLLSLMSVTETVIDHSTLYMKIIFIGMPAQMLYNYGAAILRASGDTKHPFYFLVFSGLINVAFNLVFVIVLHLDVAGVAIATIISQYISATLVVIQLCRTEGVVKLNPRKLKIDLPLMKKIIAVGLPAGIQSCLFSFSNVIIQSSINSLGDIAMAGNGAAANIDGLVYIALNSFHHAALTFTGQNLGAKKIDRIKRTCKICLLLVSVIGITICGLIYVFGEELLAIYRPGETEVIAYGMIRVTYMGATYFLCGLMDVMSGMLRGVGASMTSMIISLVGSCALRVVWIFAVFETYRTPEILYASYPLSWIVTTIALYISYRFVLSRIERSLKIEDNALKA